MKQTFHIFAKDVRRFYPEILATLAITLAFAKLYPQSWGAPVGLRLYSWVPTALLVLVLLSWGVVIARVMHAESLIGEKQFWITRPYRWGSLLAAKVLFTFTFVVLPFFAAECLLLREAGFHPFGYMPGLLFNTAMAIGIVILPLMLLASITKNFPKMLLGLFFVILYGAALAYTQDLVPANASVSDEGWWSFFVAVAGMGMMLTYQYATRRSFVIRLLVGGAGLAVAVMVLFVSGDGDFDKVYAGRHASGTAGVQVSIRPSGDDGVRYDPDNAREVELSLPLDVSGIERNTAVKADDARVVIDGPAGEHWVSHWQGVYLTWLPGESETVVRVKVNRKFYEQMQAKPVTVELTLALTKLKAGAVTRVIVPEGEFRAPGGTICRPDGDRGLHLVCRSPLRQPALMLAATRLPKSQCGAAERVPGESAPQLAWIGSLETDPAEFGITPVWDTSVYFENTGMGDVGYLCPGTPLAFVVYTPVERFQVTVTTRAVGLQHLMTKQSI